MNNILLICLVVSVLKQYSVFLMYLHYFLPYLLLTTPFVLINIVTLYIITDTILIRIMRRGRLRYWPIAWLRISRIHSRHRNCFVFCASYTSNKISNPLRSVFFSLSYRHIYILIYRITNDISGAFFNFFRRIIE